MWRTSTCSFLALVAASILVTPADATIMDIVDGNPDFTSADLAQSFVDFDLCVAGGQSTQDCYKIQWDPIFITEGVMTVDITPLNGDTSRIGRVLKVSFFNGYTGAGPFSRFDLEDKVRYEIPVISVEPPPDMEGLDIVELQVADNGGGQAFFDFNIGARDLKVQREDGTIDDNPLIIPKTELLGVNIDLTPEQQVPTPNIDGFQPFGKASLNISNIDLDNDTVMISIDGAFTGLTSTPVGAALRGPAEPGDTADPILDLEINEDEGTFGISEATINGAALSDLLSGLTYLDIATELNDSGEIRGQIIPEPSAISLLLLGLISLGHLSRRQKV